MATIGYMKNLLARFTKIQKIIIGIALLIIAGALTFFVATQKENKPLVVNTNLNTNAKPSEEEVKKNNAYYASKLGTWLDSNYWDIKLGKDESATDPFWQDILGKGEFSSKSDNSGSSSVVIVKKSDITLDEFYAHDGVFKPTEKSEKLLIAGYPGIRNVRPAYYDETNNVWRADFSIIINRDGVYYYNTNSMYNRNNNLNDFARFLGLTEGFYHFSPLGNSSVIIYNEPALGIRFEYPSNWDGGTQSTGPNNGDERSYWRGLDGRGFWSGPANENWNINLTLKVKKSPLSLEDFVTGQQIDLYRKEKITEINGKEVYVDKQVFFDTPNSMQMLEKVVVKSGNRFAYLEFSLNTEGGNISKTKVAEWEALKRTIQLTDK